MPVNATMHRLSMLLTLLIVVLTSPALASACDCPPPPDPRNALANASAVFEGTVTHIDRTETGALIHFAVSRAWKGVDTEAFQVAVNGQADSCAMQFVERESYVVYAVASTNPALVVADPCGRTRKTVDAGEDLSSLGMGVVTVDVSKSVERAKPAASQAHQAGCASCSLGSLDDRRNRPWMLIAALHCAWLLRRRLWTRRA